MVHCSKLEERRNAYTESSCISSFSYYTLPVEAMEATNVLVLAVEGEQECTPPIPVKVVAIVGLFYDISSTETRSIYSVHLLVVAVQMVPVGALVVGQ